MTTPKKAPLPSYDPVTGLWHGMNTVESNFVTGPYKGMVGEVFFSAGQEAGQDVDATSLDNNDYVEPEPFPINSESGGIGNCEIITGEGAPPNTLSTDGSFYIDTLTNDYYSKKLGIWLLKGSFGRVPSITNQFGVLQTDGISMWWDRISQSMIKPNFAITSFNCSRSTAEIGETVAGVTFSASYNDVANSATITDSVGHTNALTPPFVSFASSNSFSLLTTGSITFTLSVVSGTVSYTANTHISWQVKKFYGVSVLTTDFPALIQSMTGSLASSRQGSFTANPSATQYIYYAIPVSFGSPIFTVGGFSGGFTLVASNLAITNTHGVVVQYDIYRSDNLNLGSTTVSVS